MTDGHCEVCDAETDSTGWLLVNTRLYRTTLCESCQIPCAEDLGDRLHRANVDEATTREAVRALITHSGHDPTDAPPTNDTVADVLDEVGIPDHIGVQVLDAVTTQDSPDL